MDAAVTSASAALLAFAQATVWGIPLGEIVNGLTTMHWLARRPWHNPDSPFLAAMLTYLIGAMGGGVVAAVLLGTPVKALTESNLVLWYILPWLFLRIPLPEAWRDADAPNGANAGSAAASRAPRYPMRTLHDALMTFIVDLPLFKALMYTAWIVGSAYSSVVAHKMAEEHAPNSDAAQIFVGLLCCCGGGMVVEVAALDDVTSCDVRSSYGPNSELHAPHAAAGGSDGHADTDSETDADSDDSDDSDTSDDSADSDSSEARARRRARAKRRRTALMVRYLYRTKGGYLSGKVTPYATRNVHAVVQRFQGLWRRAIVWDVLYHVLTNRNGSLPPPFPQAGAIPDDVAMGAAMMVALAYGLIDAAAIMSSASDAPQGDATTANATALKESSATSVAQPSPNGRPALHTRGHKPLDSLALRRRKVRSQRGASPGAQDGDRQRTQL